MKAKEEFPPRVLESIEALAEFLVSEARTMEKGSDQGKKDAKEQVPSDRVKDPPAMARELRWRVKQASGWTSDDEGGGRAKVKAEIRGLVNGNKRKREDDGGEVWDGPFQNFQPKRWDRIVVLPVEHSRPVEKVKKAEGDGEEWIAVWGEFKEGSGEQEAEVDRRRNVIVKVRRTTGGVERQRVERVVEKWRWVNPGEGKQDVIESVKDEVLLAEAVMRVEHAESDVAHEMETQP